MLFDEAAQLQVHSSILQYFAQAHCFALFIVQELPASPKQYLWQEIAKHEDLQAENSLKDLSLQNKKIKTM